MTVDPNNPARLLVEGSDDLYALLALMRRSLHPSPRPAWFPHVHAAGGWTEVRKVLALELKNGVRSNLAVVADADESATSRWASLAEILTTAGFQLPAVLPPTGLVLDAVPERSLPRLGVWLMPDNGSAGALEAFLLPLRSGPPALASHADASTAAAVEHGAAFKDMDKAKLHCWLAWRAEPGQPLGTSGKGGAFRGDDPSLRRFLTWFQSVFHPAE